MDVVTLNAKKHPVARYQVKDCTSEAGIAGVKNAVKSGKYGKTQLIGTKETAKKYNAERPAGSKPMKSSGVSSETTTRVADNAGMEVPNSRLLASNLRDIGRQAKGAAIGGAVICAAVEAAEGMRDMREGRITGAEYAGRVRLVRRKGASKPGPRRR